VIYFEYLAD